MDKPDTTDIDQQQQRPRRERLMRRRPRDTTRQQINRRIGLPYRDILAEDRRNALARGAQYAIAEAKRREVAEAASQERASYRRESDEISNDNLTLRYSKNIIAKIGRAHV